LIGSSALLPRQKDTVDDRVTPTRGCRLLQLDRSRFPRVRSNKSAQVIDCDADAKAWQRAAASTTLPMRLGIAPQGHDDFLIVVAW
jgi:hypothetical protein